MEGRHPETDAYRNNVGPGDYRRCRVSLIFSGGDLYVLQRYRDADGGMPEGRASSRMLWALREQSVTLCDAFLN
jgi:hypothetical protein